MRLGLAMVAVGAVVAVAAAEALYWETRTTGADDRADTARWFAMPGKMKVVHDDGMEMILRSEQDRFFIVDPKDRTYREMTLAQVQAQARALQESMDKTGNV